MAAAAEAIVHRWFSDRGCVVRYRPGLAGALPPIGAGHSDLDTWLRWLLQAVRPTVQRCLLYVPRETIEEILFGPSVLEEAGYGAQRVQLHGHPIVELDESE